LLSVTLLTPVDLCPMKFADQLGVSNEQIVPSAGFYGDLGADAIEMIDLFWQCEPWRK